LLLSSVEDCRTTTAANVRQIDSKRIRHSPARPENGGAGSPPDLHLAADDCRYQVWILREALWTAGEKSLEIGDGLDRKNCDDAVGALQLSQQQR
jgi:hypothetical protein